MPLDNSAEAMVRPQKESYNWAAGSYLDLFIVSAFTQVLFAIALYWVFFRDADLYNHADSAASFLNTNYPLLAIGTLSMVGWMMALLMGIGFDRLPLDYQTAPFDKSTISTVATLNIIGQVFIFAGLVSGSFDLLKQLGMMGGAVLGLQLILIGPIGWKAARGRGASPDEKVGLWVVGILISLPLMGMMTILVWLLAEFNWFYNIFWAIFLDGFWLMAAFALILSHFQQRLGWHLMDADVIRKSFQVFVTLSLAHFLLEYLYQVGVIQDSAVQASISAPILWVFFVSRPDRIWKNVLAKRRCSAQILSSHSWLLATAAIGIYEAFYIDNTDMFFTRLMLIFGVIGMAVWGFSVQLHEDHLHIPNHEREERWINVTMSMVVMFGFIYLALDHEGTVDWLNLDAVTLLTVFGIFIAGVEFLVWLVSNNISGQKDWYRIPMYHGSLDETEEEDPYFPNSDE